MKKPISQATLATLVSNIRNNLAAFDEGTANSVYYAERVMEGMTQIMKDGHVVIMSIWPQGNATQVWKICIDDVTLCMGGILRDKDAVPKLLKRKG